VGIAIRLTRGVNPEPIQAAALSLSDQVSLLSGADVWHTKSISGGPKVRLSDGPHGLRVQAGDSDHLGLAESVPATCFPTAVTLASTWDTSMVREVGRAIAAEAREQGVGVVLGPGMNIKRHPFCGRNFEYLSEDPLLTGVLAAALVDGIQSRGDVGACPKHFAVNNQEYHRFVSNSVVDERTLREIYLSGFEYVVKHAQPWALMTSYNFVNGTPCSAHERLLSEVLRGEWGFDGLVMSDWGATTRRTQGVVAGMDLEMPSSGGFFDRELQEAVASGVLSPDAVTTSAQRVLDLATRGKDVQANPVSFEIHNEIARTAAIAGTVLLQNDGVLPLPPEASIGLIGAFAETPRFQGAGSSQVNPTQVTTVRDAFADHPGEVRYAPGYDVTRADLNQTLINQAVAIAGEVDVCVVMVGLPASYESEGFDRDHLDLPEQHNRLVAAVAAANPRTVVVLSNGSPVLMPWRSDVAAIVESYLGGQASGGAVYDVLSGAAEPGGRLAETFPASLDQVSSNPWFPGVPHQVEYREGLFVGYRHNTTAELEPLFPFGHGLSYTTFEWSDCLLSTDTLAAGTGMSVNVTVTNTGARPGADVVQVYLQDRTGVVLRPRRTLAGWQKVHLSPGASTTCQIELDPRAFQFYDTETNDWAAPSGHFTVEVAHSSTNIAFTGDVEVTGGVTAAPQSADTAPIAVSDADFAARLGRPIPQPQAERPYNIDSTLGEIQATRLGRLLVKAATRANPVSIDEGDETAKLMMERMVFEMPLRAVALFSGGKISQATLNLFVKALNGDYSGITKWMLARGRRR
jgi:beta-glucosidase